MPRHHSVWSLGRLKNTMHTRTKITMPSTSESRPWSNLPQEILELFVKPLSYTDRVRFGAVCASWRSAAATTRTNPTPEPPWLLLSSSSQKKPSVFFSLTEHKAYRLNLSVPVSSSTNCVGSSYGWLVMTDPRLGNFLLNPLTHDRIPLPPSPSTWHSLHCCGNKFHKAVLSTTPDHTVVVDHKNRLAICKLGDEAWSVLPLPEDHQNLVAYEDAIFLDGFLYALYYFGEVVVYKVDPPEPVVAHVYRPREIVSGNGDLYNLYLLECRGEVMMVVRWFRLAGDAYETYFFTVFVLDRNVPEWQPVESLDDMMLFLGRGCSKSCAAVEKLGLRPNCIYFADDDCMNVRHPDMGVFCLEERTIQPLFAGDFKGFKPLPVWFSL